MIDIINFGLTNNDVINAQLDIFLTFSIVLLPLFGAIALMGTK